MVKFQRKYLAISLLTISSPCVAGMLHPIEQGTQTALEVESTQLIRTAGKQNKTQAAVQKSSKANKPDPTTYKLPFFLRKGAIFPNTLKPSLQSVKIPPLKPWVAKESLGLEFPKLKSNDRISIFKYAEEALGVPLPKNNYKISQRAQEIRKTYLDSLRTRGHKNIRSQMNLPFLKPYPLPTAFSDVLIQQKQERIEALLLGANESYAKSVVKFWNLKNSLESPQEMVARDSVMAGLISLEAGWQSLAYYFFDDLPRDSLLSQPRYLKILTKQLDRLHSQILVDQIIDSVNFKEGTILHGEKANFSLAKKWLRTAKDGKQIAAMFANQWNSSHYRDQFDLLVLLKNKSPLTKQEIEEQNDLLSKRTGSLKNEFKTVLARNFLATNALGEAHAMYQSIERDGANRLNLLQEQAYVEMKLGIFSASLGKSIGAQSKYFEYGFAPDAHLIEIESRKAICDFGGAEKSLRNFYQNYKAELDALNQILDKAIDPRILYESLMSKSADLQPFRFQRYLLHTPNLIGTQNTMRETRSELNSLNRKSEEAYFEVPMADWSEFIISVNRHWNKTSQELKIRMAETASDEMKKMQRRLEHIFGSLNLLEIDIASASSSSFQLDAALNFPKGKKPPAPNIENKNHWGFDGEIWEDELDHLVVKTNSKCPQAPTAQKVSSTL